MASPRFSRRYWKRVLRFAGLCLVVMVITAVVVYVVMVLRWAETAIHPPRTAVDRTPADVGIEHYEEVSFVSADGLTLRGWYIPSQNHAAVIVCHGYVTNRAFMLAPVRILVEGGFGVLLFDWRGHGLSDGDTVTLGYLERQDLEAAIAFLEARPDVDTGRIGALGTSMGGVIVTEVAAHDPRLKAVVVEAAFPTLEEQIRYGTRGLPGAKSLVTWWGKVRTGVDPDGVRPVEQICAISPRPVLLIYGTEEDYVLPDSAERMLAAACEPKALWLVEGAGHGGFVGVAPEAYQEQLLTFFEVLLR